MHARMPHTRHMRNSTTHPKKLAKIEKEKVGKDEWKDALARMMMSTGASIHGERSIPHEDAE